MYSILFPKNDTFFLILQWAIVCTKCVREHVHQYFPTCRPWNLCFDSCSFLYRWVFKEYYMYKRKMFSNHLYTFFLFSICATSRKAYIWEGISVFSKFQQGNLMLYSVYTIYTDTHTAQHICVYVSACYSNYVCSSVITNYLRL